ncbi:MAG: hypothetical protein P4M00_10920 [Azospirillaceae bacterium]|nr:hypothetical protein [Azospirillaceae bacterium]
MADPKQHRFRPHPQDRPILARLLRAFAAGAIGGLVTTAAIVATDVGGIRSIALRPGGDWWAVLVLGWGMIVLFAFIALVAAIMMLGDWRDGPGRRGF